MNRIVQVLLCAIQRIISSASSQMQKACNAIFQDIHNDSSTDAAHRLCSLKRFLAAISNVLGASFSVFSRNGQFCFCRAQGVKPSVGGVFSWKVHRNHRLLLVRLMKRQILFLLRFMAISRPLSFWSIGVQLIAISKFSSACDRTTCYLSSFTG